MVQFKLKGGKKHYNSQLVNNDGLFLPSLTFIHNKDSCLVNESIK